MKRAVLILAALCCMSVAARAQDTIYKTDAKTIQAKILEISPSEVRYKRFSNPDGPTYVLPVGDISHIIYQNGERDDFNPAKDREESAAPAVKAKEQTGTEKADTDNAAAADGSGPVTLLPREERRIEVPRQAAEQQQDAELIVVKPVVGQVYDDNGVRGMVIALDDSGMHGLMLSLEESFNPRFLPWTTIRNPYPETGATDKLDGAKNMAAVERCIAENGLSWDDFPAFKWCRDLGEGWYLPAVDELLTLGFRFNGGQRMKYDRHARQKFNSMLKDNGGRAVDPMANYYSSTYAGDGLVSTSTMAVEPPFVENYKAHERYLVRAVRKF